MAIRVRKDVWKLSKINPWHDDILWYAKAVGEMKKRADTDPTGWVYQAGIHETAQTPNPFPKFWTQCQHSSWFFLPWHRMYLFLFEQIIADWIAKQSGGPKDWSLFYWNYSDAGNSDATKLPPAFRDPTLPGPGSVANPLFVAQRKRGNNGVSVTNNDPGQTDLTCLTEPLFATASTGATSGFCGPITGFHHDTNGGFGAVDNVPHGSIHVAVGGYMGRFFTAALDPIFWVHHANIDRLWNVWMNRDPTHKNPTNASWLTGLKFEFHDAASAIVNMSSSQVANSKASPLSYEYEDETDPIAGRAGVVTSRRSMVPDDSVPEMVGATGNNPVTLTGGTASASLEVKPPVGSGRLSLEAGAAPRLYLNLENVKGPEHSTSYSVYVNVPKDSDPRKYPDLRAGIMPLFGLAEASRASEQHSGSGLHYAFEISKIVQALQDKGDWNPKDVRVTFVPDYEVEGRADASAGVQVGRISVYHK